MSKFKDWLRQYLTTEKGPMGTTISWKTVQADQAMKDVLDTYDNISEELKNELINAVTPGTKSNVYVISGGNPEDYDAVFETIAYELTLRPNSFKNMFRNLKLGLSSYIG